MRELLNKMKAFLKHLRCCDPPGAPTGVKAVPGGGSMETMVTWDPLPGDDHIAQYRVYKRHGTGTFELLAVVTHPALGLLEPGRFGIVDAPDYWPWASGADASAKRCYAVTAVSDHGLEGPMSALTCVLPP